MVGISLLSIFPLVRHGVAMLLHSDLTPATATVYTTSTISDSQSNQVVNPKSRADLCQPFFYLWKF